MYYLLSCLLRDFFFPSVNLIICSFLRSRDTVSNDALIIIQIAIRETYSFLTFVYGRVLTGVFVLWSVAIEYMRNKRVPQLKFWLFFDTFMWGARLYYSETLRVFGSETLIDWRISFALGKHTTPYRRQPVFVYFITVIICTTNIVLLTFVVVAKCSSAHTRKTTTTLDKNVLRRVVM